MSARLNDQGAVVSSDLYDAYGQLRAGNPNNDPVGYCGQWGYYTDHSTGYILCTFRWYDPLTARWLTRDPIGYAGGINLYGYVGGNPVGAADPLGLWSLWRKIYTGNGNAPDDVYDAALEGGSSILQVIIDCTKGHYGIVGGTPAALTGLSAKKRVGPKGTSISTSYASKGCRKLFPQRINTIPVIGTKFGIRRIWAPTSKNWKAASPTVGGVAGRWLPLLGYGMIIWDLESIRREEYRRLRERGDL